MLKAWSASGQVMSTWCAERGLNWYSLSSRYGWSTRQRREGRAEPPDEGADLRPDGFVEVVADDAVDSTPDVEPEVVVAVQASPPSPRSTAKYRIALGDAVVEVDGDFEDDPLRRLLRVVASC